LRYGVIVIDSGSVLMGNRNASALATVAVSVCAVAATLVAPVGAASGAPARETSAQSAAAAPVHLVARLRGGVYGDPNGRGHVNVRLNKSKQRVCATVTWNRIGKPTQAHIHRPNGTVAVPLNGSVNGGAHCATNVRKALIQKILNHPRQYYFNVHNKKYPAGAIRGNLHY
jgi:CHRD domain